MIARPVLEPSLQPASTPTIGALFTPGPQLAPGRPLRARSLGTPCIYRVESGWCARTRLLQVGRAQIVDLLMPGDLVGLDWLVGQAPDDTIEALSDAELSVCEPRVFGEAIRANPALGSELVRHLLAKQEEARAWMAVLGQGDAQARMAHLLLVAAERGEGSDDAGAMNLPMTQARLGELLGLTPVHVNRTIRLMREAGLATVARGRAEIVDREGLEKIARGYRGKPAAAVTELRRAIS